jgi:hypothetical protein
MHPFLKYPFDMYHHLLWINDYYHSNKTPESSVYFWHYCWAKIFEILNLDNTKLFTRAYIIHYMQTIITYFSIYYFSYTFNKFTFLKANKLNLHILSAWATLIWFTIYATESVGFHLVWIQWYSVNYQISLPLTLLSTALFFNFLFNKNGKYFYLVFYILITAIVLSIHSAEFVYFLMYLALLIAIYLDKIFIFLKTNKLTSIIIFILLSIILFYLDKIIPLISYRMPKLLTFILNNNYQGLWNTILAEGDFIVQLLSRAKDSFNELMVVSLCLLIPILLISLYLKKKKEHINLRFIIFLALSSLFVLIPMYQISAGIASTLTYKLIVNRFYYSSTIFLVIPIFAYLALYIFKKEKSILTSAVIALTVLGTFIYSRYAIATQQNYYKNIQSIKNAWNERKVGFNLSNKNINYIGKKIKKYEQKNSTNAIYFAREDIAFILKYIYKKRVYLPIRWRGNKLGKNFYIKAYKKDNNQTKILFTTPKGFPKYEPYK